MRKKSTVISAWAYNIIIDSGMDHLFWIYFVSTIYSYTEYSIPNLIYGNINASRIPPMQGHMCSSKSSEWVQTRINMQNLSDSMASLEICHWNS